MSLCKTWWLGCELRDGKSSVENSFSCDGDTMCAFCGPSRAWSFAHTSIAVKVSAEVHRRKTTRGSKTVRH